MATGINRQKKSLLLALASLIRLPNLLIVALTQVFIYYFIIRMPLQGMPLVLALDEFHFFLLLVVTLIITASGYIINDVHDLRADIINKPKQVIVTQYVSLQTTLWIYFCLCVLGYMIALYLAFFIKHLAYINIYIISIGGLYAYSSFFKQKPLVGNILVALFCAGVSCILLLAEKETLSYASQFYPVYYKKLLLVMGVYAGFAFISTLFRELIKDMEDVEGDSTVGYQTAPVKWGLKRAKEISFVLGIIWFSLLLLCLFSSILRPVALICLPLGHLLYFLYKAQSKADYKRISTYTKWIMLAGLLILLQLAF